MFQKRAMIIGEAPGSNEDQKGVPFVGRAGQQLGSAMRASGLGASDVVMTNTVKCRPPGNRAPNLEELEACRMYLSAELELLNPKYILTVGGVATQALMPNLFSSIGHMRGSWFHRLGVELMPTWHPAYVMRKPVGGEVWQQFRDDVKAFAEKVLDGRS